MKSDRASVERRIRHCGETLGAWLPELAERHGPLVLLAALAEHIGRTLRSGLRQDRLTERDARRILSRIGTLALGGTLKRH